MEGQPHTTNIDQRVRLKSNGEDALYALAAAGSPGWVRKQEIDHLGYPTVFIEWDKNHWSYNGEKDMWTLEAHFEQDEEEPMSDEKTDEMFEKFKLFVKAMKEEGKEDGAVPDPEPTPERDEDFEKRVAIANEDLEKSSAFICIAIQQDGLKLIPALSSYYKTREAGLFAELCASRVAGASYDELVLDAIKRETEKSEEG